jgi:hypothetical protein
MKKRMFSLAALVLLCAWLAGRRSEAGAVLPERGGQLDPLAPLARRVRAGHLVRQAKPDLQESRRSIRCLPERRSADPSAATTRPRQHSKTGVLT